MNEGYSINNIKCIFTFKISCEISSYTKTRELTREEIQKELRDLYNSYRIALMIER
jgi:hypothetical protein